MEGGGAGREGDIEGEGRGGEILGCVGGGGGSKRRV